MIIGAKAKTNTNILLYLDPNAPSTNWMKIGKGEIITGTVVKTETLTGNVAEHLGDTCVTFQEPSGFYKFDCYSALFDFIEE